MNMQSPAFSPSVAMLWEQWRLTRVEAAQRLGMGIAAASAALTLSNRGTIAAFWLLLFVNCLFWMSISKLNGGRVIDGYKPGFPLHLLYTRPVPTVVLVGVAMAYDAVSCTALYLASVAFVGFIFGHPLPMFSVIVWLVTFHFVCTCIQWSTRSRVVQWVGSFGICVPLFYMLINHRVTSPLRVEFSLTENLLMVLLGVVAFGVTVIGVARQRCGDADGSEPQKAEKLGYADRLITLFRFQCPTSSATKAQLWFELKSSGLPILAVGLSLALLIPLLFATAIPAASIRSIAGGIAMFSIPALLLFFGGNSFGIRHKQGRTYASVFEVTQPYGTAQLARLKVLVRSVCVLSGLIAVGVSVWASSSLMTEWGSWIVGDKDTLSGWLQLRQEIAEGFGSQSVYEHAALAVLICLAVAMLIVSRAAFTALRARYPRRLNIAITLLLTYVFVLVATALATQRGAVSKFTFEVMQSATNWIAAAALIVATAYLAWRTYAERLLTPRQASGIVLLSASIGIVSFALTGMPHAQPVGLLENLPLDKWWPPTLLVLMTGLLAPWSLDQIRHT